VSPSTLIKLLATLTSTQRKWGFAQARNANPKQNGVYPTKVRSINPKIISEGKIAISHQAMLVKKSELISQGLLSTEFKIASDLEMTLKISKTPSVFVEEVLVEIDQNGLSSQYPLTTIIETAQVIYQLGLWSKSRTLLNLFKNIVLLGYGSLKKYLASLIKKLVRL
jgi:hypothetical protein